MALVYRATVDGPRGFARELCIKRIRPELADEARFMNLLVCEGRLSALLRHPVIVQVHELGEVEGEYYLAMELVEGADLVSVLNTCEQRGRPLPIGLACYVVQQLADALAYAHALTDEEGRALDIVHRDISPSNIMITPHGDVKLLDFGIAKAAEHFRDERTTTGVLVGKFGYFSPEQADGIKLDRRSDIFALGIVLWELLTHERLFRGESDLETLRNVRQANVPPPPTRVADVEPELDALVLHMLERDPARRCASCTATSARRTSWWASTGA